ncbi:protein TolQ [Rhodothalassium salexigens]|uniref:protein TolQ n=1 Tax=Rhodothalassium salexigens TaxID=1086 RepID=UPI0019116BF3|nr:protein TolQ [Rhodothalassium salexigens]MBK5910512.1 protein TolQ [Rhodothalassium salexigens]MBK5919841.1 protein TolQ [Rhodothalassium salexigens]
MQDAVPTGEVASENLGGAAVSFGPVDMFMHSDIVVQAVMVALMVASVVSWGIIFSTVLRLRKARGAADDFEEAFWSGTSLEDLYESLRNRAANPLALVFVAAMREWQRSIAGRGAIRDRLSVQDRVSRVMSVTIAREMQRLEGRLQVLATIATAAPFMGLFGTVWGVIKSFQAIAMTSNTSLAVVAPGIAEALLSTAVGLIAAIPAMVAYNGHINQIGRFVGRMEGFADEFQAILSRQLDEKAEGW